MWAPIWIDIAGINCNYLFIRQVALAKRQHAGTFRSFESSCHMPICLAHTVEASHSPVLLLNVKKKSFVYQFLWSLGLIRPGIQPESTVSVAEALSVRPLISIKVDLHSIRFSSVFLRFYFFLNQ